MPVVRIEKVPIRITDDFSVSPVIQMGYEGPSVMVKPVHKPGGRVGPATVYIGFDENDEPVRSLRVLGPSEPGEYPDEVLDWLSK